MLLLIKLLCINVTNSLQLKALITTRRSLDSMLKNINEINFASNIQSLLPSFIEDTSRRSSNTYTNPLQEVFGLTPIDQELAQSKPTTIN